MATFYIDYVNGNDANAGDSFAAGHPWKTLTLGATAARIGPTDIIKIAKSPAPTALAGTTATWTNRSKTVTLASAETLNIDRCEVDFNVDKAVNAAKIGTDWKEGTYAIKITEDATPLANERQAWRATGALNLSAYQGISFWIKNEVAIADGARWEINLYTGNDGATGLVHTFAIPAIPSIGRWIPITIITGGNLNANINSISVDNGASVPTASKYIYLDNIIAVKTNGLNLQSLISKNSAEQGGTEGWFAIQSINDVTVLLDNDTNNKANVGRGYWGADGSVNTYKRETIKTTLVATYALTNNEIMDSGTEGSNIEFQGGYDTTSGNQTGETFFDGLSGFGYGISGNNKSYITLNNISFTRYWAGLYLYNSCFFTVPTLSNCNNNSGSGIYIQYGGGHSFTTLSNVCNNSYSGLICYPTLNTFGTISNANGNFSYGIAFDTTRNNKINLVSNVCNNSLSGLYISASFLITVNKVENAQYNGDKGIAFATSNFCKINWLSTANNVTGGITYTYGQNYIRNALIAEGTEVTSVASWSNDKLFSDRHNQTAYSKIFFEGGNIVSRASTLANGSGKEWLFTTATTTVRKSYFPLNLVIARIAVTANNLVTVKAWFKKGHATDIGAKLVCRVGQVAWSDGDSDVTVTKANDTNEEELQIQFTPTEDGVVEIEAWAYYVTGHSTVIVDAMTITQA